MLGVFAEFENRSAEKSGRWRALPRPRRRACTRGASPPLFQWRTFSASRRTGISPTEIAKRLGVGRTSVYPGSGHGIARLARVKARDVPAALRGQSYGLLTRARRGTAPKRGCWYSGRSQRTWPCRSSSARSALSATSRATISEGGRSAGQPYAAATASINCSCSRSMIAARAERARGLFHQVHAVASPAPDSRRLYSSVHSQAGRLLNGELAGGVQFLGKLTDPLCLCCGCIREGKTGRTHGTWK